MRLVPATKSHLLQLMAWFPDQRSCSVWGGQGFRFPFTFDTFSADLRFGQLHSYALLGGDGMLFGFGQYSGRAGRCHLSRLAISADCRGRGFGAAVICELCRRGCAELGAGECSLFVLKDNAAAIRLYDRMGFAAEPYPEAAPELDACLYMAAPAATVAAAAPGAAQLMGLSA